MMMVTPLRRTSKALNLRISHQIVPVVILNFFDEVEFLSGEMCENGSPECSMDEEESVSC